MVLARRVPVTVHPTGVILIVRSVMVSVSPGRKTVPVRIALLVLRVMVSGSRGRKMVSVRRTVATLIVHRVMVSVSRGPRMVLAQRVPETVHPTGVIPIVRRVMVSASPG